MGVIEQLDGPYGIGRDDARGEGRRLLVVDGSVRLCRCPDHLHVRDRPLAPAFVAVGHIWAELIIQAKADPIQFGGLIAGGQPVHRLPDLIQMIAERFRQDR